MRLVEPTVKQEEIPAVILKLLPILREASVDDIEALIAKLLPMNVRVRQLTDKQQKIK